MVQAKEILPNITDHNKQHFIPLLGVFITPFYIKNERKRKPQAQQRHAGNRQKVNKRNQRTRQQQHGHEQWTSNWTTTTPDNHQQWQPVQEYEAWDATQSCEHQSKRQRGSASYSGSQSYGGSSSSYSTPWNSAWGNWYEDKHWHGSSW